MRYFLNDPSAASAAWRTKVKEFKKGAAAIGATDKDFPHQYMTLTKCDLYFADKAIMVEGAMERILMPRLRQIVDRELDEPHKLVRQYVMTMEVGGAFAHLFYPLVDFLELKTLIITDLDAVKAVEKTGKNGAKTTKYESCVVADGERTANTAIRHFFHLGTDGKTPPNIAPAALVSKTDPEKIKGSRRIACRTIPKGQAGAHSHTRLGPVCDSDPERLHLARSRSGFREAGPDGGARRRRHLYADRWHE